MNCEPKNEYEQDAYLNQKGKYKSISERSSEWGNWIQKNTATKKHRQAGTPPNSLLLYLISLIS